MNLNTVKGVFVICVTIVLSFVLFIAYNEHIHRYCLVVAPNNDLYIFDKKGLTVNICNRNGCEVIDTRLVNSNSGKLEVRDRSVIFVDNTKQTLKDSSLIMDSGKDVAKQPDSTNECKKQDADATAQKNDNSTNVNDKNIDKNTAEDATKAGANTDTVPSDKKQSLKHSKTTQEDKNADEVKNKDVGSAASKDKSTEESKTKKVSSSATVRKKKKSPKPESTKDEDIVSGNEDVSDIEEKEAEMDFVDLK